ncbi:lytic transglycosylase domain-containing protein [Burkholderia singularis]|uniref:Soluble lytic murein transglycosylase and related regulatory proteins (Some contain LysM/invasin domains) n=1 Tax=Burkholderia singularis TaxID=1503053 RepID=A0A238HAF6_9BURK|nr:lytic transglycosylase domain-containing protein [Burkholderia singularis]SMG02168.1 Soluble lytic murein transglycosylase and related regulatory proteins (some contain LysM/invasin domains) [Burkholderia singularis]
MNAWLSWRPNERHAQMLRVVLRRGTRVSHHLFSVVGCCAVAVSLALWLLPNVRGTLAAKLMPFVSAAVEAGPARLLSGHPLPSFGPSGVNENEAMVRAQTVSATPVAAAAASPADATFDAVRNGVSPVSLAKLIPAQRVAADARDNRALVSNREQALVATYLARRYRVAQEPLGQLVKTAFETGREVGIDPLLILAVMAIESGFNPYAESGVGAQGLMQVMSKVHSDKFEYFGGTGAALQPLVNIQVGALVLKDCIARGGSVAGGLRLYVGAASADDGGYGAKVISERDRLRDVARGRKVPIFTPQQPAQGAVTTVAVSAPGATGGSQKRVHATLDSAHPLTMNSAAASKAQPQDDDASVDTAAKHDPAAPDLGT